MALKPQVNPCIDGSCKVLNLTEISGIYTSANTGGWGAPNIQPSAASSAILTITTPNGSVITENILSQLPSTYIGPFALNPVDIDAEDGEYKIKYEVVAGSTTYKYTQCYFSACVVRCCIDTLHADIVKKAAETESCKCNYKQLQEMRDRAALMEAMYKEMLCGASWDNVADRDKLLAQLQKLCKINKCNCGCS
jgi:hypothetical protein